MVDSDQKIMGSSGFEIVRLQERIRDLEYDVRELKKYVTRLQAWRNWLTGALSACSIGTGGVVIKAFGAS